MGRRSIVLALIFCGILINYVDRGNLGIAAASLMDDFRLPPQSMGVLLSAFFWTYGLFQIPAGLLVDRFGIRWVYAGAFLVWSLSSAAIALSRGFGDILLLRLMLGVAETVGPLASLTFIRQKYPAGEQGLPVSIYIAGQMLGPACGTLLGSVLLANFGWRFLFAATGLGALLWIPAWAYFAPGGVAKKPQTCRGDTGRQFWRVVLTAPAFWALGGCIFFLSYYWYFILTWVPAFLIMSRGFSTLGMGRVSSIPLFIMAVTNMGVGAFADRLVLRRGSAFGVRTAFLAVGLAGAAAMLLLNFTPGKSVVLPVLIVSFCSFGVANVSFWTIAQHVAPASSVGSTLAILNTISQIAGAAAPLITGWTLGPSKNFGLAILLAGASPLIALALLTIARPASLEKLAQSGGV